jgi:hypothetical protein
MSSKLNKAQISNRHHPSNQLYFPLTMNQHQPPSTSRPNKATMLVSIRDWILTRKSQLVEDDESAPRGGGCWPAKKHGAGFSLIPRIDRLG